MKKRNKVKVKQIVKKSKRFRFWTLILCILIPLFVGFIGSFFTSSSVSDWYLTLNKPSLNPPSWVFGPVWSILFILMGIALYLVYVSNDKHKSKTRNIALGFFTIQLILNIIWSFLFFAMKNPLYAFIEIILLWLAIVLTMVYSYRVDRKTFWFLIPYLLWVSFASYLNYSILFLN